MQKLEKKCFKCTSTFSAANGINDDSLDLEIIENLVYWYKRNRCTEKIKTGLTTSTRSRENMTEHTNQPAMLFRSLSLTRENAVGKVWT